MLSVSRLGGEPLRRPDLPALAEHACGRGMRVVLSTNGTLITEEVAGRLAAAGVSYIGISVDGRPETHHGFRASPGAPLRLTGAGYQVRGVPGGVETRGVNGGKGFMFIDHVGNFCPSGFLQLAAANVRTDSLTNVYRQAPLFRELRDPAALRGRCGRCRYADLRGGSRARASAVNGSHLADDPLCGLHEEAIACASHRFAE